eukprot:scaffold311071_cov44-Prasinocladus_malaysianus.AAC.1
MILSEQAETITSDASSLLLCELRAGFRCAQNLLFMLFLQLPQADLKGVAVCLQHLCFSVQIPDAGPQ